MSAVSERVCSREKPALPTRVSWNSSDSQRHHRFPWSPWFLPRSPLSSSKLAKENEQEQVLQQDLKELFQSAHCLQNPDKSEQDGQVSNQSSMSKLPHRGTSLNKAVLWAAPELESFILASTVTTWSTLLTQRNMAQFQALLRLSNFKHLLMFVDSPERSWPQRSPRQPGEQKIQNPSNNFSARQEGGMETEGGKVKIQTSS